MKKTFPPLSRNISSRMAILSLMKSKSSINGPMNIWLHAKCRKFIDPDEPEEEQVSKAEAEEEISGKYEDNNEPA
jgi:hypothetical protein